MVHIFFYLSHSRHIGIGNKQVSSLTVHRSTASREHDSRLTDSSQIARSPLAPGGDHVAYALRSRCSAKVFRAAFGDRSYPNWQAMEGRRRVFQSSSQRTAPASPATTTPEAVQSRKSAPIDASETFATAAPRSCAPVLRSERSIGACVSQCALTRSTFQCSSCEEPPHFTSRTVLDL